VSAPTTSSPSGTGVPARADGVELIGEIPGSGYREPPSLVRRADGQTLQLTRLLYRVLESVDGERTLEEVAQDVSRRYGRLLSGDDVRALCDSRLRPLGLLRMPDGSQPKVARSNPLLGLRFRYVVTNPEVTRRLTAPFAVLFHPLAVVVLLLAFVAVSAWVLVEKGLASATHQAFDQPGLLLVVFGLTIVSAGFHEFGHAAAARYGGATPGAMGTGLYLVWPAFYTDVTDSYRLGRGGRVRTDLGGLYFNAIVAVLMFGVWWGTRWDALLLIIAAQLLQMVRQLSPLVRFDGYHVLADTTGVPDLYQRIGPTLRGLLPGRWNDPEAKMLKPWARAVVTAWVVLVVPLMLLSLVLLVMAFPRLLATAGAGLGRQWGMLANQWDDGEAAGVAVRLLSVAAILIPLLGIGYMVGRIARQVTMGTWRATEGRPARRAAAGVVAAALVAALGWSWWPHPGTYRPVQAYERGALQDAAFAAVPGLRSGALQEGGGGRATTLWPRGEKLPAADSPVLALVLVPREDAGAGAGSGGEPAPTWVFPFNRPAPPGEGDNQALAVNTGDGSTVYDVAFALVWADEGTVANTNEAYALASCTGCTTVAVAFQVILVLGQADVVAPENLAVAVNYACLDCLTYALATQLVVTLSEPLSEEAVEAIEELWQEIAEFSTTIEDLPLAELQARLAEYEAQILQIIEQDQDARDGSTPRETPTSTHDVEGTPTDEPAPEESQSPTSDAADGTTDSPTSTEDSPTQTAEPSPTASEEETVAQ
jgi:putative peptide zinc metalloprotease protein